MYLDSVCIYDSVVTAHRRKIKTGFAFFDEVFHQPDNIACSVFLTLLIEIRSCKTTIAAKQEMDGWIIIHDHGFAVNNSGLLINSSHSLRKMSGVLAVGTRQLSMDTI